MAVLPKPQLDFLLETTFTQKVKRCASSRICGTCSSAFLLNGIWLLHHWTSSTVGSLCRAGHLQTADSEANAGRAFVSVALGLVQMGWNNLQCGSANLYELWFKLPEEACFQEEVCFVCVQAPKPGCRGKGKIQHSKIADSLTVRLVSALFRDLGPTSQLYPSSASLYTGRWDAIAAVLLIPPSSLSCSLLSLQEQKLDVCSALKPQLQTGEDSKSWRSKSAKVTMKGYAAVTPFQTQQLAPSAACVASRLELL